MEAAGIIGEPATDKRPIEISLVVGGYNSSNTTHL